MDSFDTPPPTARQRQDAVAEWMNEREAHTGLGTSAIVDLSGAYDRVTQGRFDTGHRDMLALERRGLARREGRPACWYPV